MSAPTIATASSKRGKYLDSRGLGDAEFGRICRVGGFVDGWDEFDHRLFGISAREAEVMDPQQRLILETVFEATMDAGLRLDYLQRHRTGVVCGYITRDYWGNARTNANLDAMTNVGNTASGLSGRVSHVMGLTGPAVTIDTACSSGLASVATAIDNITLGRCDIAIAASTNLVLDPIETLSFYTSEMIAPDGLCKFGTHEADGFVRSDGFAAVVLRPLDDALAENDRIYGVIEATAVGNDGGSSGSLPTPSVSGQIDVIQQALDVSERSPDEIVYVEAHGTGTTVGDRVELESLGQVFAARHEPLLVGSVKTRIGHCEATSGLAGLITALLGLHHRRIAPMLVHGTLRDDLLAGTYGLLAHTGDHLPVSDDAVVGVSSFGITGTNVHAIVSASPPRPVRQYPARPSILPTQTAGESPPESANADNIARFYRTNRIEPEGQLVGLWGEKTRTVFAFGGFGAGWLTPGVADPVLDRHLISAYEAIRNHMAPSERASVGGAAEVPAALQPYATWATQTAIAATLREYGAEPDAVLGHSFGDLAAAVVAGALSLDEGARLLVARTEAVRSHAARSSMIVVTGDAVAEDSSWLPSSADIAVVNSTNCVVVACEDSNVDDVISAAVENFYEARLLEVVFGSHSRLVEEAATLFGQVASTTGPLSASVPFYSSTSDAPSAARTIQPGHWRDNLRRQVNLPVALDRLKSDSVDVVVDIGPRSVLAPHLRSGGFETVLETDAFDTADFVSTLLTALDRAGVSFRACPLPPWSSESAFNNAHKLDRRVAPLLAPVDERRVHPVEKSDHVRPRRIGTGNLRVVDEQLTQVFEHRVRGVPIAPGTLSLSLMAQVLAHVETPLVLQDVRFVEAVDVTGLTELFLEVTIDDRDVEVSFAGRPGDAPDVCVTATLSTTGTEQSAAISVPTDLTSISVDDFYASMSAAGNHWGPPFRCIAGLWVSGTHAWIESELAEPTNLAGPVDPALFDGALHGVAAVHYGLATGGSPDHPFLFEGVERLTFHEHTLQGRIRSLIAPATRGHGYDVTLIDEADRVVVTCEGLRIRPIRKPPAVQPLHLRWLPIEVSLARTDRNPATKRRNVHLASSGLGIALLTGGIDRSGVELWCKQFVADLTGGSELVVDFRGGSGARESKYLAMLGMTITSLAVACAGAGVTLGAVVDDVADEHADNFEQPGSSDSAAARFVFSLCGSLAYEVSNLAIVVVSVASPDSPGHLPSLMELAQRGEHRLRRSSTGELLVARLTEADDSAEPGRGNVSAPRPKTWLIRVRSPYDRTAEIIWVDPEFGHRIVGERSIPVTYGELAAAPEALWAVHSAAVARSYAQAAVQHRFVVPVGSRKAELLKTALGVGEGDVDRSPDAVRMDRERTIGVALGCEPRFVDRIDHLLTDVLSSSAAYGAVPQTVLPSIAFDGLWPRELSYTHHASTAELLVLRAASNNCELRSRTVKPIRSALVIGGRGGLGTALIADLKRRGMSDVLVVGSSPSDPAYRHPYVQYDITNSADLCQVIDRARSLPGDVMVFHLAGRLSAAALTDLDLNGWFGVLEPKVEGLQSALQIAREIKASQLVLYSSASGVLPSPRFAHYGAANAAADGIALSEPSCDGLAVAVIRWGFWEGPGMLKNLEPDRRLAPDGVLDIAYLQGHDFLWDTVRTPRSVAPMCYPARWGEFAARYPRIASDRLLANLIEARPVHRDGRLDGVKDGAECIEGDVEDRSEISSLEHLIMDTLRVPDVTVVRTASRLRSIGLDSLLAVELRTKIRQQFDRAVTVRTLLGPITSAALEDLISSAQTDDVERGDS